MYLRMMVKGSYNRIISLIRLKEMKNIGIKVITLYVLHLAKLHKDGK